MFYVCEPTTTDAIVATRSDCSVGLLDPSSKEKPQPTEAWLKRLGRFASLRDVGGYQSVLPTKCMIALIPRYPSCAACDFHGLVAMLCDEALRL